MLRKVLLSLFILISAHCAVSAETSTIKVNRGEKWWGIFVGSGNMMPFSEPFGKVNIAVGAVGTDMVPLLISSTGRYIYSKEPFSIEFTGENFIIESDFEKVAAVSGGRTLREAYLVCCHKNFPPDGKTPSANLFLNPVYELKLELGAGTGAGAIMDYAGRLISVGYPAGTLVIPAGWELSTGTYTPNPDIYPDFTRLVSDLHGKGFKVMLTVTPFVSADGQMYREHRLDGYFIADGGGKTGMVEWDGGISACYDMTNSAVFDMIRSRLDSLHSVCGVDGFLFDCRNAVPHIRASKISVGDYLDKWSALGEGFDFSQYTVSRESGFAPYVHNFSGGDMFDMEFMRKSVVNIVNAGMLGYPYSSAGANIIAEADMPSVNTDMLMRYIQLSAALPVMNIPVAPWSVPGTETSFREAVELRRRLGEYIGELVGESARNAEPVVRHMEYAFPRNGFSDCDDQFMIGTRYLVAPLFTEGNGRTVRFPRGVWVDSKGTRYRGPLVANVSCLDGELPVFELSK